MHTFGNFAILRDFMEIAWYRDHRAKYSSLAHAGEKLLWIQEQIFKSPGQERPTVYQMAAMGLSVGHKRSGPRLNLGVEIYINVAPRARAGESLFDQKF